jgi:hypothetical protein
MASPQAGDSLSIGGCGRDDDPAASVSECAVAVAQSRGGLGVGRGRCLGRSAGHAGLGAVTFVGAFSGPQGGCLVAVELGEVVTHHD